MKISKEQKDLNRKKLLRAAVEVMAREGFKGASMAEIGKRAGLAEATIYKYFPTKDHLLYGYFHGVVEEVRDSLREIKGFSDFSFQEQVQTLIETELTILAKDRDFVIAAFGLIVMANLGARLNEMSPAAELYGNMITDLLNASIEVGEIPDQTFLKLIPELFWDYNLAVIKYWCKDSSPGLTNTTQMVDKSLSLCGAILQGSVLNKFADLFHFFIRQHLFSRLEYFEASPGVKGRPSKKNLGKSFE